MSEKISYAQLSRAFAFIYYFGKGLGYHIVDEEHYNQLPENEKQYAVVYSISETGLLIVTCNGKMVFVLKLKNVPKDIHKFLEYFDEHEIKYLINTEYKVDAEFPDFLSSFKRIKTYAANMRKEFPCLDKKTEINKFFESYDIVCNLINVFDRLPELEEFELRMVDGVEEFNESGRWFRSFAFRSYPFSKSTQDDLIEFFDNQSIIDDLCHLLELILEIDYKVKKDVESFEAAILGKTGLRFSFAELYNRKITAGYSK